MYDSINWTVDYSFNNYEKLSAMCSRLYFLLQTKRACYAALNFNPHLWND